MEKIEQIILADLQPLPGGKHDDFFNRCVDEVAANLIGMFISNKVGGSRLGGQIIETEAYCQHDPAAHCHSDANQTRQSGSWPMSRPGGHIYVYPSMLHDSKDDPKGTWCLNLTCGLKDFGSAVLIRALRPTSDSIEGMKDIRREFRSSVLTDLDLCNGPGSLHEALGLIGNMYNGELISKTPLRLCARTRVDVTVKCGQRVNIPVRYAAAKWPRSYILDDHAAAKFLSPGAKAINKICGRESFPPSLLQQLKTSCSLAKCNCLSEDY